MEEIRIGPIVAACDLKGKWGDDSGFGTTPWEFVVNGVAPSNCPNCAAQLSATESVDSGDWNIEFWASCDPCGLVWHAGSERMD